MKRMITILVVLAMLCGGTGYCGDAKDVNYGRDINVVCIEGYKFVIVKSAGHNGIDIEQIFCKGYNGLKPPQPMKCEDGK